MNLRTLIAAVAAVLLLLPGTAVAGKGNGKPAGKPEKTTASAPRAQSAKKAAKKAPTTRKSAKAACKGLSKKHVKGTKGTPYSRCIVAAAQLRKQAEPTPPVNDAPFEPAPVVNEPVVPAPAEPTEPVQTTDPVQAPSA